MAAHGSFPSRVDDDDDVVLDDVRCWATILRIGAKAVPRSTATTQSHVAIAAALKKVMMEFMVMIYENCKRVKSILDRQFV
jgi:hypothetical protein